jgi:type IV pilus assembly protein PilC
MPQYKYAALGPNGKKQAGTISAPSSVVARYELIGRELRVQSLRERKPWTKIEITKKKIKPIEIANMSRQLGAFLRAGISILDAIEAISAETTPTVRQMLQEMGDQLRSGDTFADAISSHAEHFPRYYPGIVRSAELSGRLDSVLDQLASYIERDLETTKRVKSALTYPMIVGVLAIVVVVVLIGFVLPKFKDFFEGLDADLPMTTKFLLGLGDVVSQFGKFIALGALVVGFLLVRFLKSERGHNVRDRAALRVPVVRDVVQASVIERFCRILSAMLQAGIPIADAMAAAIDSTNNRVYKKALVPASEAMLRGDGLSAPLAETGLFPGMVLQMMRVGEETGTLDHQLEIAADFYGAELRHKLDKMTSLFEPAIIVAMGLVVGFVAVALVQAMYGVYSDSGAAGG